MVVNAIDFSDLTKKPKPQGFQTPPPQPPQQQLGVKNPKTGKVEPAMGYPVNQMGQGDELLQLFPIPVMICPYPVDYTKELEWIRNKETRKENKGGDGSQFAKAQKLIIQDGAGSDIITNVRVGSNFIISGSI